MIKRKYLYILIIIILAIVAFELQTFVRSEEKTDILLEEPVEIKKPSAITEIQEIITKYDSLVTLQLKESGTVGAALVVTYKNEIALLKCFGNRKAGEDDKVNKNTVFRLASVSKAVTGVLAGILDDEKIIDLDEKVVDYLPGFELMNIESTNNLTVRHLLSHTSGLIPHAYDLMVEDHVPLEKIIERLDEVDITAPPGKLYGYQNVVYSIYDPIVLAKTEKSFDLLLKEKVFDPFGMTDASTGYESFRNNENIAYPHYNRGHNRFRPLRLNDRYYNTTPAAGINASISDLAQFLLTLSDDESKLFSHKARETVFTPQVKSPLKRSYFRSWGRGIHSKHYSIGWRIVDYKGRIVAYHGGYVRGYKAEIALCEEEDIGIAILTNSPVGESAKNIPTFLNMLFEYKDNLAMKSNSDNASIDKS
jgi:beta-lactamase class C